VHPIVFGAYGEVSEGKEVLIGKLADAWAPQVAGRYLLDNVLAAEGIARSILREEIGAACFNAHGHVISTEIFGRAYSEVWAAYFTH
jgi:hypothetical protein